MKRVLFICSGNLYRSAAAESILRRKLADAGVTGWTADSAGTLSLGHAARPDDFGRLLTQRGYESGGVAKYVYDADPSGADLILVMEPGHAEALKALVPMWEWGRIRLFMDFCFGSRSILADPAVQLNEDLYRETLDVIERGCDRIVEKIINGQI